MNIKENSKVATKSWKSKKHLFKSFKSRNLYSIGKIIKNPQKNFMILKGISQIFQRFREKKI